MCKNKLVIKKDSIIRDGKFYTSVEIFKDNLLSKKMETDNIEPILEQVCQSSTSGLFEKIKLQQQLNKAIELFDCKVITVKER
jgi:hypothetical protein